MASGCGENARSQREATEQLRFRPYAGKIVGNRERTLPLILTALISVVFTAIFGCAVQTRCARRRLESKLEIAANRHFGALAGVRAEALFTDHGEPSGPAAWQQEIERFLDSGFSTGLTRHELRRLEKRKAQLARLVAERIRRGVAQLWVYR